MNENLEDVKVKLPSTPISPGVQPNDQAPLKVPSVTFQSSAIVSISSMTTPVTTPALVSGASMNSTARPFVPKSVPTKEECKTSTKPPLMISYHMSKRNVRAVLERIQALWEGTRLDQNYLDIQRKQAELSEMNLLPIKLGVSHLVTSHQRSLEMLCHTRHL